MLFLLPRFDQCARADHRQVLGFARAFITLAYVHMSALVSSRLCATMALLATPDSRAQGRQNSPVDHTFWGNSMDALQNWIGGSPGMGRNAGEGHLEFLPDLDRLSQARDETLCFRRFVAKMLLLAAAQRTVSTMFSVRRGSANSRRAPSSMRRIRAEFPAPASHLLARPGGLQIKFQ